MSRPSALPQLMVWITWGIMTVSLVVCVCAYTYNLPLAEDWHMVPPLTGHEPHLWTWLWEQNNEHRVPLPKLVLLAVLTVTRDFRGGMLANIALIAAAAAAILRALASARGGRVRYTDAFIPIVLLHIGNWENFMWAWQLGFVLPSALTLILLIAISGGNLWTSLARALTAAGTIAALPLCGANGMAFAAPIGAWLTLEALIELHAVGIQRRLAAVTLVGIALGAAAGCYYFVGYTPATWNPPSPGRMATVKTSLEFLALGFGPSVSHAAGVGAIVFMLLVVPVVLLVITRTAVATDCDERRCGVHLLAYLSGIGALAVAFGWGRAGLVATVGLPGRYVLLAVPALVWTYVAAERFGSPVMRRTVQGGLLAIVCALLPLNTQDGFQWRDWYRAGMRAVVRDIDSGLPRAALVERHGHYLMHWSPERLSAGMLMLHTAGIGPFRALREPAAALTMRYRQARAVIGGEGSVAVRFRIGSRTHCAEFGGASVNVDRPGIVLGEVTRRGL